MNKIRKDIESRSDIEVLIPAFYDRVLQDPEIGFYFHEMKEEDWKKHMPLMVDFWENVIFYTGAYSGNPMDKHRKIHAIHPLTSDAFDQWLNLFEQTVDDLFTGKNADEIKLKARNIATIMKIRIIEQDNN